MNCVQWAICIAGRPLESCCLANKENKTSNVSHGDQATHGHKTEFLPLHCA